MFNFTDVKWALNVSVLYDFIIINLLLIYTILLLIYMIRYNNGRTCRLKHRWFFKIIQFINPLSQRLKFNSGDRWALNVSVFIRFDITMESSSFEDSSKYELIRLINPSNIKI